MAPSGEVHTPRGTNSSRSGKPQGPAVYDNTTAAAAVMGQGKLTTEAGMAAARQAATQVGQPPATCAALEGQLSVQALPLSLITAVVWSYTVCSSQR